MTELQEARLLGRAINGRWDIPAGVKADAIATLHDIANNGLEESARIAACRALIAAEGQNQKDEHAEANDLKRKILELAAQFGVLLPAGGSVTGGASGDRGRIADGDGDED